MSQYLITRYGIHYHVEGCPAIAGKETLPMKGKWFSPCAICCADEARNSAATTYFTEKAKKDRIVAEATRAWRDWYDSQEASASTGAETQDEGPIGRSGRAAEHGTEAIRDGSASMPGAPDMGDIATALADREDRQPDAEGAVAITPDDIGYYVDTSMDTDLDAMEFVDMGALHSDDPEEGDWPALSCKVRLLGNDYNLVVRQGMLPIGPWNKRTYVRRWFAHGGRYGGSGSSDGYATKEEAIEATRAYARDVLGNGAEVMESLSEEMKRFMRQAVEAGARIKIYPSQGGEDTRVEIRAGSSFSTPEHPFGGDFLIMRDIHEIEPRGHRGYWEGYYFLPQPDDPRLARQERTFEIGPDEDFSIAHLVEKAGTCMGCGKVVPVDEIVRIAFTGGACKDCAPALKREYEQPGWCD